MTVIIQAPFSTFRADRTINKKLAFVLVPGIHRHFEIEKKTEEKNIIKLQYLKYMGTLKVKGPLNFQQKSKR